MVGMLTFGNLVSDSPLVQETIEMLRLCGGCAPAGDVADIVLKLPDLDSETASLLITDLIKDDSRLRINPDFSVEVLTDDAELRRVDDSPYVVVDVETTGAKTPPCRITEIGAYRIERGRIVAEFETLVNPQTSIPPFIVALTGIREDMVRNAPLFEDILPAWLEFAGDAVLVAHNAQFDVRFLNHEISRLHPGRRMANTNLCTVKLSRAAIPGLTNYRLHTIADHFGIPIVNRHRAAGDALATAEIFLHILERLSENGIEDIASARRFRLDAGMGAPQDLPAALC